MIHIFHQFATVHDSYHEYMIQVRKTTGLHVIFFGKFRKTSVYVKFCPLQDIKSLTNTAKDKLHLQTILLRQTTIRKNTKRQPTSISNTMQVQGF